MMSLHCNYQLWCVLHIFRGRLKTHFCCFCVVYQPYGMVGWDDFCTLAQNKTVVSFYKIVRRGQKLFKKRKLVCSTNVVFPISISQQFHNFEPFRQANVWFGPGRAGKWTAIGDFDSFNSPLPPPAPSPLPPGGPRGNPGIPMCRDPNLMIDDL